MNLWKKLLGISLAVGLSIGMSSVPALADTVSILDELTEEETTADFAEDTSYYPARSNNLNYGNVKIQKLSDHEVAINGHTQCHRKCSKVYLSLFLEKKGTDGYSTYKIWEFTANNATNLDKEICVLVPSGTYYRVRGYHAASKDGVKESTSTLTSGILIK